MSNGPPPPPPGLPPSVAAPTDGADVSGTFDTFGTSNAGQQITSVVFTGNGQNVNGTITQQTDQNGDWAAQVDVSSCPSASGYTLTVSNGTGPTSVNNLRIP